MKVVNFFIIVVLLSILISCPNYNNPVDPKAEDYQGWVVLGDGEVGDPLVVFGISPENYVTTADLTPLIDWLDMDKAAEYEVQWASLEGEVSGSTINTVTDSEFQISSVLSVSDYVFWRLRAVTDEGRFSSWSDIFTFVISPADIGDSYEGGIVFYLGYDTGIGLVAADSDQSTGIQWYNGSYTTTGATATGIGTGGANTTTIVANQGVGSYAAQLCEDLDLNTYTDWFLPSMYELNQMHAQKGVIGGFVDDYYWSSSEHYSIEAWVQYFGTGSQYSRIKNDSYRVRAVRAFTY